MRKPPPAVRFMLLHGVVGFAISALFTAFLLTSNPGGLATLLLGAASHPLPTLMLWFLCGLTFGSVQIGAAVMLQEDRDAPPTLPRPDASDPPTSTSARNPNQPPSFAIAERGAR